MSASSFVHPVSVQAAGRPAMAPRRRTARRRTSTRPAAVEAQAVIERIQVLMRKHKITFDELRDLLPQQREAAKPEHQVLITRCPSISYDPRYQLPPSATVVGPFTTEWRQLRRDGK